MRLLAAPNADYELELDAPAAAFNATLLTVLLAPSPRVVIAPMPITMMRASMTAYSTAVGPSSDFANRTSRSTHLVTNVPFLLFLARSIRCDSAFLFITSCARSHHAGA